MKGLLLFSARSADIVERKRQFTVPQSHILDEVRAMPHQSTTRNYELDDALRRFMYGKLHRVTVTEADVHYVGSITIDPALLRLARIFPHTEVDVVNLSNGTRVTTYAIEGTEGSGVICLNGAAARLFVPGDLAIVMAYEHIPAKRIPGRVSRTVHVSSKNQVLSVDEHVTPSLTDLGKRENDLISLAPATIPT